MSNEIALFLTLKGPISLWDMIEFVAVKFFDDLGRLEVFMDSHVLATGRPTFTQMQKDEMIEALTRLEFHCQEQQLEQTATRCVELKNYLGRVAPAFMDDSEKEKWEPKTEFIFQSCDSIKLLLITELQQRKFAFIPVEKAKFFEAGALFGRVVQRNFRGARDHIKNAGNCLAADLNTAAVFHLMCVVEIGLRALAKQLKVKTVKKTVPLELGTWEDVIKALEAKVNASYPKTTKAQQESDFYKGLFLEYRAFKDYWRNKVMHTRVDYDANTALSAYQHVCAFMQRLAEKVSEVS
jgi:hypothetical protein